MTSELRELFERRVALRLSLLVKNQTENGETLGAEGATWEKDLEEVNARLAELGVLTAPQAGLEEVGEVGPEVVTLRGSNFHVEEEATPGPADRLCKFCDGTGERTVDMEIDGFVYEIDIDCPH